MRTSCTLASILVEMEMPMRESFRNPIVQSQISMAYIHTLKGLPKRAFRSVMAMPVLPECLAAFTHSDATIFMAHRFRIPELGIAGHDPQNLRQTLAQLRKRRYDLISIEEVFCRIR